MHRAKTRGHITYCSAQCISYPYLAQRQGYSAPLRSRRLCRRWQCSCRIRMVETWSKSNGMICRSLHRKCHRGRKNMDPPYLYEKECGHGGTEMLTACQGHEDHVYLVWSLLRCFEQRKYQKHTLSWPRRDMGRHQP